MRALLIAFASVAAGQPQVVGLARPQGAPPPAPTPATAAGPPAPAGNAAAPVADRQFLFANPAADALALKAIVNGSTSNLLLAGLIDQQDRNRGGYYPNQYFGGGGFFNSNPWPASSYSRPYQTYAPSYPSYPATTVYPPVSTYYPPVSTYYPPINSCPCYYQPCPTWCGPTVPPPRTVYPPYPNPPNDPLKQVVLLSGVQSGKIDPVAAVGLDRNPGVNALGATVFSSLGNTPLTTALAVSGGLGGNNYYRPYGGTVFGNNGLGNYLVLNSVLQPGSSSSSTDLLTGAVLLNGGLNGGFGGLGR